MENKKLENLGLNKSESQIYITLLRIGSSKAGKLAKETKLNRTTVYKALENLMQKGLVSFSLKENRKYFEASDPKNITNYIEQEEKKLKEKRQEVSKILPELNKLFERKKEESEINIFKGIKGLKTVFNDITKTLKPNDEYLAFGVSEHAQIFWGYFEEFNKTLMKNKVKSKIIFDERAKKNIISCKKYGYEVKTLSKEFMSPAEINLYKNKVAIIVWHKNPLAVVIKEEKVANSFKQYFNLMWKIAT